MTKGRIQNTESRIQKKRETKAGFRPYPLLTPEFCILLFSWRFGRARLSATGIGNQSGWNAQIVSGRLMAHPLLKTGLPFARQSAHSLRAAAEEFLGQTMYFALMILLAILAAVLVLFMERRGDPRLLEREYKLRANSSQAKDSLESRV